MKTLSRRVNIFSLLGRMLGNRKGSVVVYVALITPILIGIGALTIDLTRLMSLNTELQSASDAAALACARELDRFPGARDRCMAAAQMAVTNLETFGTDAAEGLDLVTWTACPALPAAPIPPCIRILNSLPDLDTESIAAANEVDPTCTTAACDEEARYGQVFSRARSINNILIKVATFGAAAPFSQTDASAIAGQNQVICDIPPMFMCNPTEPVGNTDFGLGVDIAQLEARDLNLFQQGGNTKYSPGNFGLLCPLGTDASGSNCGGNAVKESLASTEGTCVSGENIETKTGVTLGPVVAGINSRLDMWTPLAKGVGAENNRAWRTHPNFIPAANTTMGREPPNGNATQCWQDLVTDTNTAFGLPQDQCFLNDPADCATATNNYQNNERYGDSIVGTPTWNFRNYFRINHGCDLTLGANADGVATACKPADWDVVTLGPTKGAATWPPTRFDTYRYELEKPAPPQAGIIDRYRTIPGCTMGDPVCPAASIAPVVGDPVVQVGTAEDGTTDAFITPKKGCFDPDGLIPAPAVPGYNWHSNDRERDLTLLNDRRVLPLAIANCIAIEDSGGKINGKFAFTPPEFVYVFIIHPMPSPNMNPVNIHVEMIGKLDDGAIRSLVRDVVQLYRRRN